MGTSEADRCIHVARRWKPFGAAFDEWMELSEGLGMKPITPKLLSAYELACARIERLTNM